MRHRRISQAVSGAAGIAAACGGLRGRTHIACCIARRSAFAGFGLGYQRDRRCRCARKLEVVAGFPRAVCCATRRWRPHLSNSRAAGWCRAPLFINQLVHVIMRNALDGVTDVAYCAPPSCSTAPSASRCTRVVNRGRRGNRRRRNAAPVSPLVSMLGIPPGAEIDVINDDNADELLGA